MDKTFYKAAAAATIGVVVGALVIFGCRLAYAKYLTWQATKASKNS